MVPMLTSYELIQVGHLSPLTMGKKGREFVELARLL